MTDNDPQHATAGQAVGPSAPDEASADAEPADRATAENLRCPNCGYNLRGLEGDVRSCPECGSACDVDAIRAMQWFEPLSHVPGMQPLGLTVAATLLICCYVTVFGLVLWGDVKTIGGVAIAGLPLVAFVVYAWVRPVRLLGAWRGIMLAVLLHVTVFLYLCAASAGLLTFGMVVGAFTVPLRQVPYALLSAVIAAAMGFVFAFIATACINTSAMYACGVIT